MSRLMLRESFPNMTAWVDVQSITQPRHGFEGGSAALSLLLGDTAGILSDSDPTNRA
jgi:hypothetical protein